MSKIMHNILENTEWYNDFDALNIPMGVASDDNIKVSLIACWIYSEKIKMFFEDWIYSLMAVR